jgi:hypothetical protein
LPMNDAVKPKRERNELPAGWGGFRDQANKRYLASNEFHERKPRLEKKGATANGDQLPTGRIECDRTQSDAKMRQHRASEFTKHLGDLCTRREMDIDRLAVRLAMDQTELLRMINGRLTPTSAVLSGLARELETDVRYLEALAEEIVQGDQRDE